MSNLELDCKKQGKLVEEGLTGPLGHLQESLPQGVIVVTPADGAGGAGKMSAHILPTGNLL